MRACTFAGVRVDRIKLVACAGQLVQLVGVLIEILIEIDRVWVCKVLGVERTIEASVCEMYDQHLRQFAVVPRAVLVKVAQHVSPQRRL